MLEIAQYDEEKILEPALFEEIFNIRDQLKQMQTIIKFQSRAKELRVKSAFDAMLNTYRRHLNDNSSDTGSRHTDFAIPIEKMDRYKNMKCGSWVANGNGVVCYNIMGMEQRAGYQPILPVERLENIETGEEQIVLAFYRDHHWKEITVPKDIISSSNKIVALSKYGLSVTSENSKHLVKYLNDVENMNNDEIDLYKSTSKLGWHGEDFIPYDKTIVFDGDSKFKQLFEAISFQGHEDIWIEHVKKLRATGRPEIKFMLAASFASALIKPLGILPFFVDLWGETEGGKSVSLMLACSVWANPDASQYIGDYKSTDVALEVRADVLNNLPVLLDDTSNATKKIVDDFENIIYRLCSGKGKSRSNKDLGTNRENTWKNCFITNGERPLSGYVNQAGAINRIIEIEAGNKIYDNPQETATLLKMNYGWAGKRFIEEVKQITDLKERYDRLCQDLFSEDKMQKQAMSLACILLADSIATDTIFKDDASISLAEARNVMVDRTDLSEPERCYNYLLDNFAMNSHRFTPDCTTEKWGMMDEEWVYLYPVVLDKLCTAGGFSRKSFVSWGYKNGVVQTNPDGYFKQKKIFGKNTRVAIIKLQSEFPSDANGFIQVEEELELPFT